MSLAGHPIALIIGTRPEAIKLAPVVLELARRGLPSAVVATAQHRELMDDVLQSFGISPDVDLDLMRPGQSPAEVLSQALPRLAQALGELSPAWVVVQGDTVTTLAGALAAYFAKLPVAHVEAGLRTGNPYLPFPEEQMRRLTDQLAQLHFAPTPKARENLLAEGIAQDSILVVGNTELDAQRLALAREPEQTEELARFLAHPGTRLILTLHRRESWDKLPQILSAIAGLMEELEEGLLLYPVHPNPQVRQAAEAVLASHPRVILSPPLNFFSFTHAMAATTLIITDSGGIQEAATGLTKPVVVVRDVTERPEAVEAGYAVLGTTSPDRLTATITGMLERLREGKFAPQGRPYGDGHAAKRIVDALEQRLS